MVGSFLGRALSAGRISLVFGERAMEDYPGALSRLRWHRTFSGWAGPAGVLEIDDPWSMPAPGAAAALARAAALYPDAGIVPLETLATDPERRWTAPALSTLSQIERIPPGAASSRRLSGRPNEAAARFLPARLPEQWIVADGFRVVSMPRRFGPRPEIARLIPAGARRILDVGCGAGELAAEVVRRSSDVEWTGIERDPALSREATGRVTEVIGADAMDALAGLLAAGRRFDTFILADVLEHFGDPAALLHGCRAVASPGATIIVSVPNVAFFSLTAELLAGRFDPLGAGPLDAGHLRWFTKSSLRDMLVEVSVSEISLIPIPAAEDGSAFLRAVEGAGVALSPEEITPVQWLARGRFP